MSGAPNPFGKGLAFPPRVGATGRLTWSEGERDVEQSIGIILRTDHDERIGLPQFGASLSAFLFEPNNAATHARVAHAVEAALKKWEPRIAVDTVDVAPSDDSGDEAIATISYRLVATGNAVTIAVAVPVAAG
ncbi:MAG TPA: GPW/gp25 family protein [Sphingomicrobium sp.]